MAVLLGFSLAGCKPAADQSSTVTLYCSVDPPFAQLVVDAFQKQTGIRVQLKTDTEAGKTTSLVRRIEAERTHPQADVFWSSEVFQTVQLARSGLLVVYRPAAEGIPDEFKDPDGRWIAFGLRARVLAYNHQKVRPESLPRTWREIADPKWKDQLAVADPRFGTTRGHFAACYALWGETEYRAFLQQLAQVLNGRLNTGNADTAADVGRGYRRIGATDTDDVYASQAHGEPIDMIYPDMGNGGTLLIPNTAGLISGAPHPEAAQKLIDFLASEAVEELLASSDSRNIPVRASLRARLNMKLPPAAEISYSHVAEVMDKAVDIAAEYLIK